MRSMPLVWACAARRASLCAASAACAATGACDPLAVCWVLPSALLHPCPCLLPPHLTNCRPPPSTLAEVELCDRLHWRLLPTVEDMRELLTAIPTPQASYWSAWLNAPRRLGAPQAEPKEAASGETTAEVGVTRLPHAKSVQDSLVRLFRGGHSGSDGNLAALGSKPGTQGAGADGGPTALAAVARPALEEGGKSSNGGSPRSVLQRTFSLSNLFGLSTGW